MGETQKDTEGGGGYIPRQARTAVEDDLHLSVEKKKYIRYLCCSTLRGGPTGTRTHSLFGYNANRRLVAPAQRTELQNC